MDILIEVIYAEPQRSVAKSYRLTAPACIADALRRAADDPDFQGIAVHHAAIGVFGRLANVTDYLNNGDRVELYRPLAADPKVARRARARRAR